MQFNDSTNKNGLVQDCWFTIFGDSLDHSTAYPIADIARYVNDELYQIGVLMWRYSPLWAYDDSNQTTSPIATTTLVNGQREYPLETRMIHIERVSVMDKSGIWHDLTFLPFSEIPISPDEYYKTSGLPRQYSFKGNALFLSPPPSANDVTLTNGLKIYLSRIADAVAFTASDTTKTPGFNPAFHRLLSLSAALKYLLPNNPERYDRVKLEYRELQNRFIDWLQTRQRSVRQAQLQPRLERYE